MKRIVKLLLVSVLFVGVANARTADPLVAGHTHAGGFCYKCSIKELLTTLLKAVV